ncbi:ArsR/SmtB family transcription factor [Croceicoccus sediminis]|uniref:ArsR/SmtB family transcription factor n=1 Tax=Croceicoccus sediminis TaxID=2571150 RepID=UPI0011821469|nr:metalloregulator ArsR/SmtB family transcription factor [Croceicoccus sediminis]
MSGEPPIDALKAVAHPVRYRILQALSGGELNVGQIEEATEIAQPGLSQQLAVLRGAGLVQSRKQAKLVFYSLDAEAIQVVVSALADLSGATVRGTQATPRRALPGAANFARLS